MNRITDYGKLATDITNWIKNYAETNNIKSLVIGVSGGIDSAVVSTLCAMTGLPTYCCIIPISSNREHTNTAMSHYNWLLETHGTDRYLIHQPLFDLTDPFKHLVHRTNVMAMKDTDPHVMANIKSRMRMLSLYAVATQVQGIVVGTGNKVEDFGVGFYTKYGDGGVDISPIADLYKSEVRELSRHLGISQEIIDAVPTDGLWEDGRSDEDQIGATYEELEWIMGNTYPMEGVEPFTVVNVSVLTDRQREVANIYYKLQQKNLHKMLPIPIYKLDL